MSKNAERSDDESRSKSPIETEIWYISYRSKIGPQQENERPIVRATRRFKTEADAKQFAIEVIRDGWSAIAGTIDPHKPKRTISSRKILDWIAEEE